MGFRVSGKTLFKPSFKIPCSASLDVSNRIVKDLQRFRYDVEIAGTRDKKQSKFKK